MLTQPSTGQFSFIIGLSDLGVHVDGYIAVVAHTARVGAGSITGRAADVTAAAYTASECAQRMLKPSVKVFFSTRTRFFSPFFPSQNADISETL